MIRPASIEDALDAAARWRLLGLLFERPSPGWADEVRALAAEVRHPALAVAADLAGSASEGPYLRLLGPGGAASPREAGHAGFADPGWILADLARHYEAFGFAPRVEDPLDHVAVETAFVAYLHLKEAAAAAAGDGEAAQRTARVREAFTATHLATIATPLARRLAAVDGSHLAAAAAVLASWVPAREVPPAAPGDPLDGGCGACPAR